MWSFALFNLRIGHKLFWKLTPRQYDLLAQRHREELIHREMVSAFTTAAVVNHSFSPPEKPVPPSHWIPNFKQEWKPASSLPTLQQIEAKAEFQSRSAQLTVELKSHAVTGAVGPLLKSMGYGEKEADANQLG